MYMLGVTRESYHGTQKLPIVPNVHTTIDSHTHHLAFDDLVGLHW